MREFQYDLFDQDCTITWYTSSTLHGLKEDVITRQVWVQHGKHGKMELVSETKTVVPTYVSVRDVCPW